MGFLDNIKNVVSVYKAVSQNIASTLTLGIVPPGPSIVANPGTGTLGTVGAAVANNPLTAATVIAVPSSSAGRAAVGSAVSSLSTTGKIGLAAGSYLALGAVSANPGKAATAVLGTPSGLTNVGKNVGVLIDDPSLSAASKVFKDNPVIAGALTTGAALAAGSVVAGSLATMLNTQAVKANTAGQAVVANTSLPAVAAVVPAVAPAAASVPQPATQAVAAIKDDTVSGSSVKSSSPETKKKTTLSSTPKKTKTVKKATSKKKRMGYGVSWSSSSRTSTRRRPKRRSAPRKQRKPHTAGKRKDTSTRRIRYTKNNQPYVILASGKARFITKRSAANSRKRKGGRY